ncbi:NAD(P)H-dependent oxidoreductase [uncultured Rubinisphaera sp.]|uniref:NADPH-dependent FMN reductase n=1 Tax=uncultured Rubinisphaera sp. TaxID=1678686 RepID=UPI0030DB2AC7
MHPTFRFPTSLSNYSGFHMYLVIACSLKSTSKSRLLAEAAERSLKSLGREVELINLRDFPLPFCDAEGAYADPHVATLSKKIIESEGILIACPIYNYGVNAALKNLIELTGQNWQEKVIGFLCAAGGTGSYMSIMGLANSLMLDFRCFILPKFVYATGNAFEETRISDEGVEQRISELGHTMIRISSALRENP